MPILRMVSESQCDRNFSLQAVRVTTMADRVLALQLQIAVAIPVLDEKDC